MADTIKKFISLENLTKYDQQIKAKIAEDDAAVLAEAKEFAEGLADNYEAAGSVKTAKEALESSIAEVQGEVDALETLVGTIPTGEDGQAVASTVIAYVDKKTEGIATDAALGELTGRVTEAEEAIAAIEADYLVEADKTELSTAITEEATTARAAEKANADAIKVIQDDYLKAADKTELQDAIDAVDALVDTLVGEDTGKSARTIANEELAKQLVAEGAKESLDTLAEIAAWIQSHPDDASAMNKAIEDLEALVGTLPEGVTATTIVGYIQEVVAAEKSRAEAIENGLAGRIAELEGLVGIGGGEEGEEVVSVAEQIATALAEAKAYSDEKDSAQSLYLEQTSQTLLAREIDKVEETIATLTETVGTKATQADLEALAGRVTTAEGEIDQLQTDVDAAELLIAANDAAIKALQEASATHAKQSDLDSAVARITANEEAIASFVEVTDEEIEALFTAQA